jgi:small GTP-binding protein
MANIANENHPDCKVLKIVVVGDSGVGKTQLLNKFAWNEFDSESKSTIGVNFLTKFVEKKGAVGGGYKLQLWDTAGQERYRAITSAYYRGSAGMLLCYDSTKRHTFENISKWLKEINEINDTYGTNKAKMILIATQIDRKHLKEIPTRIGQQYATDNEMSFFETSALTGEGIDEAMTTLVDEIFKMLEVNIGDKPNENKKESNVKIGGNKGKATTKCC